MILLFFELEVSETVHSTKENHHGIWNYGHYSYRQLVSLQASLYLQSCQLKKTSLLLSEYVERPLA